MSDENASFGGQLRQWRRRRRMSQLDLALTAAISQRHLSFVESGRSRPSRDMVIRLAERLSLPMRARNALLLSAGYAPIHSERSWSDPALQTVRRSIELVLAAYEPFPSLAVDRHWTMVMANKAVGLFLEGIDADLLHPPVNVLRLSLHPKGLAPRIANLIEWRDHVLARLGQQIEQSADGQLVALLEELESYPAPYRSRPRSRGTAGEAGAVAVPLRLRTQEGELSFLSTTTVFGTPLEITLSELAIESFLPADAVTLAALQQTVGNRGVVRRAGGRN
jgi:transcriptional regulator with XRE-family HTH domain